ncbi:ABC transporter substrate-binding protein [Pseudoalteromonas sp. MMG013]|uniref:MlaC/ttg2D family ABC transporter substrate-binding protein n=1 Tax=unclassified Pseudoalteromonas TaxID=194690 RepID=UPI001B382108|nr:MULTISPECIES: ABC transporter substrate-binding protein [unclassified Pseudoalteromonas]MBQ4847067.1 ABC transporter substrate-binding protein [Pseudoalteromonas sp. MMG005]MBQ4861427.1 ABC transporter substrate-binding protein [Pseudoalteromonas sp. MMG013]
MLRKWICVFAGLLAMVSMQSLAKVDLSDPYSMVQQVADNTFKRVARDQEKVQKNKEHLRVIVQEELMPYIDYKYAAYRVLGSYIQKIRTMENKEDKAQAIKHVRTFIDVFQRYLVATYAGVFTQYTDQKVEFGAVKDFSKDDVAIVKTKIIEAGKPDIRIDFKVRKGKNNEWRAYDMMAEGISLLDAKQTELHGILRQQGIEHVIQLLDKKSRLPVQFRGDDGSN